jgi:(E)-4-hydroxy-3-methylbut-2-enyl-diphosphate synthase
VRDRRKTRAVKAGPLLIGGGFPVSIQTMWKKPISGVPLGEILPEIKVLKELGCDLLRLAVPDMAAAESLGALAVQSPVPLVADIHFDHTLALRCMDFPVAKIRINPGTISEGRKVEEIIRKAQDRGIALRIGINAGSLPRDLESSPKTAAAMVCAAEREIEVLDKHGFRDAVFSLKSSDVDESVEANLLFSSKYDYPLHIGITEAGPLVEGIVKNTIGISRMLENGVGDTIRVSLSASPSQEIITGREILRIMGIGKPGMNIVSCPQCGRSTFNVQAFLDSVYQNIQICEKTITLAVMGCPVNGPGEAKKADLGISGAGKRAILFRKGVVIRQITVEEAKSAFLEELKSL